MQSIMHTNVKADSTPQLGANGQKVLMLRFNLQRHDYVMQRHTWLDGNS